MISVITIFLMNLRALSWNMSWSVRPFFHLHVKVTYKPGAGPWPLKALPMCMSRFLVNLLIIYDKYSCITRWTGFVYVLCKEILRIISSTIYLSKDFRLLHIWKYDRFKNTIFSSSGFHNFICRFYNFWRCATLNRSSNTIKTCSLKYL